MRGGREKRWLLAAVAAAVTLLAGGTQALADTPVPSYTESAIDSPSPEATSFQGFGIALARAGDVDRDGAGDIIAGNSAQTVSGLAGAGRAWVFSGRTRQVIFTLTNPEPQADAAFGRSVIGIGDVNGDGISDLEVGAPRQDVYTGSGTQCGQPEPNGCNENQGKAFVFSGANGGLLYPIDDPVPQASANFGFFYVTAPGDLNGDGTPDVIITARGENAGGLTKSGAAYAFNGKNGSMLYRIDNPNPEAGANFGQGIGDPGDINGDGVDDYVIGAGSASGLGGGLFQGRAYLFNGRTGARLLTLDDPIPQIGASFGATLGGVGAPGDVNGDGVRDIYVNATQQNVNGLTAAGKGYILSGRDGSLIRAIDSPALQQDAGFGFAYDDAGDLNGDGTRDLLVGQFSSGNPTGYTSGAWVIDPRSGGVLAAFPGTTNGPGDTLASPGDVNGDTCPDYFLGGPTLDAGGNQHQGRIIVELSQGHAPSCGLSVAAGTGTAVGAPRPTAEIAVARDLSITPPAFFAAARGPSAQASAAATRRPVGARVSYELSIAASVRFTVERASTGRRVGRRCVAPRRSNRRRHHCTRYNALRGSFTLTGKAGHNSFRFSGRLSGRRLSPGTYQLVATPSGGGRTGTPAEKSFRIRG